MKKRILWGLALLFVAVLAGGWIFRVRTGPADPEYRDTIAGDADVAVWFESGVARDAAEKVAADYREAGWEELPVSTETFRLFAKGTRTAAVLAEDLPTGVRLTELRRKGPLW